MIVGNGPSLNRTDLSTLRFAHVISLNRGYLKLDEVGITPTFHVCVNQLVAEQFADELVARPCPLFATLACRKSLVSSGADDSVLYLQSFAGPFFGVDVRRGIWEGATVTYTAMQLAYYLGYQEVLLIGVDHRFSSTGTPHRTVVADGPDPNHFAPNYFGPGVRWQLPDLETSERAYRLADRTYRADGRRIVDCTVGGALTVFPKAGLSDVLVKSG